VLLACASECFSALVVMDAQDDEDSESDGYDTQDEKDAAQSAWTAGQLDPTNNTIPGMPGSSFYFDQLGRKRQKKTCDQRAPVYGAFQ
jgi:hypothetical protein